VSSAGALAAVERAASLAKAEALRCRARIELLRSQAHECFAIAQRAVARAVRPGSLSSFECATLTDLAEGCRDRAEQHEAHAAALDAELAAAHEERRRWETLKRGLERRIAHRRSTQPCRD